MSASTASTALPTTVGRSNPTAAAIGATAAVIVGSVVALLAARGLWFVVLALLLVVPSFVVLHRYPLVAVSVWLVVAPFVTVTDSRAIRTVFWLVHRLLPVAALAAIVLVQAFAERRKLDRIGLPEVVMACYVAASALSVVFRSAAPFADAMTLYDRVIIPMALYLLVRVTRPSERDLRRLQAAVIFLLVTQSVIGLTSWISPGMLPSDWLVHVGERTSGSFRDPNVFGAAMLFCGLFLLTGALAVRRGHLSRSWRVLLFVVASIMVFLTFSRANWLALIVGLAGALIVYRRHAGRLAAIAVPVVAVLFLTGMLSQQVRFAEERLRSEQATASALSRLPVIVAAVRMFEEKPVIGWGYENFDRFSRPYQVRVGNLVSPAKAHASHNLFLTLLAEQGVLGFGLFLAPTFIWLARTARGFRAMPAGGFLGRRSVVCLWLVIAGFVIVNNFAVMHVTFGLGLWWFTLGLIGSIVGRYRAHPEPGHDDASGTDASEGVPPTGVIR